jgi:hypothetical protein
MEDIVTTWMGFIDFPIDGVNSLHMKVIDGGTQCRLLSSLNDEFKSFRMEKSGSRRG